MKMFCGYFLVIVVILYILYDVNYFLMTFFCVISGRFQRKQGLHDTSTIYGMCTFQDCDVTFKSMRLARIVRELDFARYHFYDRTGIYQRSVNCNIKSLQGCTLTLTEKPLPIFTLYKINTKLVYWDENSFFFEHKIITVKDDRVRYFLVSRQHALGEYKNPVETLLGDLPRKKLNCPKYIDLWLKSMAVTSRKLKL